MNENFSSFQSAEKRKAFISFHHDDEWYRDEFNRRWGHEFIGTDVKLGDIDSENSDEYVKRLIQEDHIVNSSVVVALYGANTRKRKHVDWEISAGLSEKVGGRKGLVVMILPGFPAAPFNLAGEFDPNILYPYLHPRTADNVKSGYADVYFWPGIYSHLLSVPVKDILELAATKRETHHKLIENWREQYTNNLQ